MKKPQKRATETETYGWVLETTQLIVSHGNGHSHTETETETALQIKSLRKGLFEGNPTTE